MSALFRRRSTVICWFCNSTQTPLPPNPRNFRCRACHCWNRYNEREEIISDEPAMHEEYMNRKNFMKRASLSKERLPSAFSNGPFCHACQTNQTLLIGLLSNYLPAQDTPLYEQRLREYPNYRASLEARYPPVCEVCQPAVDEEIQRKEQMARQKALGHWLKEGKVRQQRMSGTPQLKEKVVVGNWWWKIRGALWGACSAGSIILISLTLFPLHPLPSIPFLAPILPVFVVASLLWTAWDPTYMTIQKGALQGRDVRVHGKHNYIGLQLSAWLSRLLISLVLAFGHRSAFLTRYVSAYPRIYLSLCFLIELAALFAYYTCLQVRHPPPIRLIDTHAHFRDTFSRSATPATAQSSLVPTPTNGSFPKSFDGGGADLLASLTLSNKPIMTPPRPVFGLPSFGSPSTSQVGTPRAPEHCMPLPDPDEDAMDIDVDEYGNPSPQKRKVNGDDYSSWLRPQRFFAPEKPTGLESLFEQTKLRDDDAMVIDGQPPLRHPEWRWRIWIPIFVTASCLSLAFYAWFSRRGRDRSPALVPMSEAEL